MSIYLWVQVRMHNTADLLKVNKSQKIFWLWSHCQKRCQISSLRKKFEQVVYCKGLEIETFCSGLRFGTFFGNVTKIQTPSEIKLPFYFASLQKHINKMNKSILGVLKTIFFLIHLPSRIERNRILTWKRFNGLKFHNLTI